MKIFIGGDSKGVIAVKDFVFISTVKYSVKYLNPSVLTLRIFGELLFVFELYIGFVKD